MLNPTTKQLIVLAMSLMVTMRHAHAQCSPVTTEPNFDLATYISKPWYVQQQAVNRYLPADRFFCVRASYQEKSSPSFWGYTIDADNVAKDAVDGEEFGGQLCAYQKDPNDAAKLAVAPCWLGPAEWFAGDYWVVEYDEAQGYALISGGQPTIQTPNGCQTGTGINESGLWIFTRQQTRDDALIANVRVNATAHGFDVSVLLDVVQEGCIYDSARRGLRGSNN